MTCPKCGSKTRVSDNSHNYQDRETYRQRICSGCGYMFYTMEIDVIDTPAFREAYLKSHRRNSIEIHKIPDPTGGLSVEEMREAVELYKKSRTDPAYERLARFESIGMEPDKL